MQYNVPLVGKPAQSQELLTKVQGYVRARGGLVEVNCPGFYDGPLIPWDKAKKIAVNGIKDCIKAKQKGEYVRLQVPGQPERRGPPEQVLLFMRKFYRAARQAEAYAKTETKIFKNALGG